MSKINPYTGKEVKTASLIKKFVVSALNPFTIDEAMESCGLYYDKRSAVKSALFYLVKKGVIHRVDSSTYERLVPLRDVEGKLAKAENELFILVKRMCYEIQEQLARRGN